MAIDGKVYSGKEVQIGIAEESTFGVPVADSAAFTQLVEFGSVSIDYGLTQDLDTKNRGKRYGHTGDVFVTEAGGIRTITINDYIVRKNDLADLLYGVFQNVTEEATTPFQKTFQFSSTGQPDFVSNAGHFMTVGIKHPISGRDLKFTSCIISELKLKADLVGGDGRLKADITFISGFASDTAATFSGTWTINNQDYIRADNFSAKTINSIDVVLYSVETTLTNNATRVGNDSSGECQTYSVGVPEYEITASIEVKEDDNTKTLVDDMLSGIEQDGFFSVGTSGNDGYFALGFKNMVQTGNDRDMDRQEGISVKIEAKCIWDGTERPSIVLADGVDKGW